MPLSYDIDRARRRVTCRAWGVLSAREVAEQYRALAADPAFDPSYSQLADLREVEHIDIRAPTVRREALETVFDPGSPRAFLVRTHAQATVARLYALYAKYVDQNVRVFMDLRDAERWLGQARVEARRQDERERPEQRA